MLQARQRRAQEGDQFIEQLLGATGVAFVRAPHGIEHVEQQLRIDARLHRLQTPLSHTSPRFALSQLGGSQALGSLFVHAAALQVGEEEQRDRERIQEAVHCESQTECRRLQ